MITATVTPDPVPLSPSKCEPVVLPVHGEPVEPQAHHAREEIQSVRAEPVEVRSAPEATPFRLDPTLSRPRTWRPPHRSDGPHAVATLRCTCTGYIRLDGRQAVIDGHGHTHIDHGFCRRRGRVRLEGWPGD